MGSKIYNVTIVTDKHSPDVNAAIKNAFRSVGGYIQDTPTGIVIRQGTSGVTGAFSADFSAIVNFRRTGPENFAVDCTVNWSMNALSWICLVTGWIIFGILWIVPIMYLFVNPDMSYQMAMSRIQMELGIPANLVSRQYVPPRA